MKQEPKNTSMSMKEIKKNKKKLFDSKKLCHTFNHPILCYIALRIHNFPYCKVLVVTLPEVRSYQDRFRCFSPVWSL